MKKKGIHFFYKSLELNLIYTKGYKSLHIKIATPLNKVSKVIK